MSLDVKSSTVSATLIIVDNVSSNVTKETLHKFFSAAGKVIDVKREHTSPGKKGQFLVYFQEAEMARSVQSTMNGVSLGGSKLRLRVSEQTGKSSCATSSFSSDSRPAFGDIKNTWPQNCRLSSPGANTTNKPARFYALPSGELKSIAHKNTCNSDAEAISNKSSPGGNCNLYVLNLSLNMTNETLKTIMARIGTVKHVCILATLDNAGRRRAFVDMSTPEEARLVIQTLHGQKFEGYELNISYAFVQRSGGPGISSEKNPPLNLLDQRRLGQNPLIGKSPAIRPLDEQDQRRSNKNISTFPNLKVSNKTSSDPFEAIAFRGKKTDGSLKAVEVKTDNINVTKISVKSSSGKGDEEVGGCGCSLEFNGQESQLFEQAPQFPSAPHASHIQVSNLSPVACIDSDDLYKFFINQGFNGLKSAELHLDLHTGMSMGRGVLRFETIDKCQGAFETLSQKKIVLGGVQLHFETPNYTQAITMNENSTTQSSQLSPPMQDKIGSTRHPVIRSCSSSIVSSATLAGEFNSEDYRLSERGTPW